MGFRLVASLHGGEADGPGILISLRLLEAKAPALHGAARFQSQLNAPPDWYSMTRVSKKLRSFFRSIISLIHGNGFCAPAYSCSRPICWQRRLAMKRRYSLNIGAFRPSTPRGMVSSA